MKILITGASGLLGKYLIKTQPLKDGAPEGFIDPVYDVVPCYRNNVVEGGLKLDLSNTSSVVSTIFKLRPDIIIHCAANGNVDNVEANSADAIKCDLLGTIQLKEYCEATGCRLVTISTNAVYAGDKAPYGENAVHYPINFYGKIKSLADDIIRKSNCNWIIVRPICLYGWPYRHGRGNWVTKVKDFLTDGRSVSLVTDSFTQPTYVWDVANVIWGLIKKDKWKKEYNVSSGEDISLYDFGKKVAVAFGLSGTIKKATLADFPEIAPRPKNTCFNTYKIKNEGFEFHSIEDGLLKMKFE